MEFAQAERTWGRAQEKALLGYYGSLYPDLKKDQILKEVQSLMQRYAPSRRFAGDWVARHLGQSEVCLEFFAGNADVLGPLALAGRIRRLHVVQEGVSASNLDSIVRSIPRASERVVQRRLAVHASTWERALPNETVSRLFLFRTGIVEGAIAMDNSSIQTTLSWSDVLSRAREAGIPRVTVVDGLRDPLTPVPQFIKAARQRIHQSGWHVADSKSNNANGLYAFDLVPGE